jgi:hypothetical protein
VSDDRNKRSSATRGWALGLIVALLIYVLAPGPIDYMLRKGMIGESDSAARVMESIYEPWFDLVEHVEPLRSFYDHYLRLWKSL